MVGRISRVIKHFRLHVNKYLKAYNTNSLTFDTFDAPINDNLRYLASAVLTVKN